MNQEYLGTEHILLGLIGEEGGLGATALKNLGVDLPRIRWEIEAIVQADTENVTRGTLPQTPRARSVLGCATEEAAKLKSS
jgi:ATP-dependent Clp protease ATP-binding subunit ClpC